MVRMHRAISLLTLVLGALVAATAVAQGDMDFLAARTAFERGDRSRLDALAPKLADHVLAPYVEYWQQKLRIDSATDGEINAYLDRWPKTPLADRLRVEWLKSLGKRGQWASFATLYSPLPGEDVELACYGVQYRRQRDGDAALADAKPLWFTGQSTPDSCEPLFAALIAKGELTVADRRARFRLATEAGNVRLAQSIAADLPPNDRITARDFARVEASPGPSLARGSFRWEGHGGSDLALYALERAARTDAAGVRAAWEKLRNRLSEADRLYGNARIAFHAARQQNPQAAEWYREIGNAPLSDAQRAWRVRAALRVGAWPDVLAAIEAMPSVRAGGCGVALLEGACAVGHGSRGGRGPDLHGARGRDPFLRHAGGRGDRKAAGARERAARARCRCARRVRRDGRRAPRRQARAARHAAGVAARMALRRARAPRRVAAAGGGVCATRRALRPRDQHRRTDDRRGTISGCAT